MISKRKRHVSKKITDFARGQDCTLRIAPRCSSNETTVFCHISFAGGVMAGKPSDTEGAFGCYECHTYIDQHKETSNNFMNVSHEKARACQETRQILLDAGLIKL